MIDDSDLKVTTEQGLAYMREYNANRYNAK